ncbi:MAG TPA: hypothetical protein VLK58_04855 [Conexibacter sp.]|nr:hypothetical protein [Conexibacter sp.]
MGALATALPATAAAEPPDGRVYEMVSPADKGGLQISATDSTGWSWAGTSGDRILYGLYGNIEGNPSGSLGGSRLIASRTPAGWQTRSLLPKPNPDSPILLATGAGEVEMPTPDLEHVGLSSTFAAVPGAVEGRWNLFDQAADGAVSLLAGGLTADWGEFPNTVVIGRSDDGRHVVVESFRQLTPDAPAGVSNIYELVDGRARLVGIADDGTPLPGGAAAAGSYAFQHVISADGSRIVFLDPATNRLHVRIDGERTVALPPLPVAALPRGLQTFYYATPDGSRIAFQNRSNANVGDAYLFDVDSGTATRLTDGIVTATPPVWSIIALSDDARYVYFGSIQLPGTGAPVGKSIYVWHDGVVRYVGPLSPVVSSSNERPDRRTTFISRDGRAFVFQTARAVGAFPATVPASVRVFRYDAPSGEIACVSCRADGTATGAAGDAGTLSEGVFRLFTTRLTNSLSSDGRRVFFQTAGSVVDADVNDRMDVYQWTEEEGPQLVSTGRSTADSFLGDASADGESVFLFTYESLVPEDVDDATDLYVARVGGGLPSRVAPEPDRSCPADGCQGPPRERPGTTTPGSERDPSDGNVADPIAPADPVPFELTVTKLGKQAAPRLAKRGTLIVRFHVNRATKVSARLQVRRGGRWIAAGATTRTLRGAGSTTASVRLSKRARRQLTRTRRLTVRIELRAGGQVRRQQLTVKAPVVKKGKRNG